ncbi:Regulator of G-protein signaling 18 [Acipenser ruthenus]|uniref:Regulator of G-protein signaling 18 n=1 Tax=Acipenser ruthenus TaxID=7906 RepID=A0A444UCL5_ACIRT|nr:Regulator of G-protein signaling 18 [Acipenser ruthenus]
MGHRGHRCTELKSAKGVEALRMPKHRDTKALAHWGTDGTEATGAWKLLSVEGTEALRHRGCSIISPVEALKWSDSFEKLLANKDGLNTFTTFLKSQFSEENIEFWLACEDFKKNKSTKLASEAKQIYSVYIETEAPKAVNIDFSTSQIIKQNVQNPTQSCFDTAQSIIYSLMKKDCYPRFLKSDIYLNLIQNKPPSNNMFRRRSRSCIFNDRIEAETDFGIWL